MGVFADVPESLARRARARATALAGWLLVAQGAALVAVALISWWQLPRVPASVAAAVARVPQDAYLAGDLRSGLVSFEHLRIGYAAVMAPLFLAAGVGMLRAPARTGLWAVGLCLLSSACCLCTCWLGNEATAAEVGPLGEALGAPCGGLAELLAGAWLLTPLTALAVIPLVLTFGSAAPGRRIPTDAQWDGAAGRPVGENLPVSVPVHQIRARYSDETITVYQAYPPEIAEPALRAGRFVAPFKRGRMTWVKPSFLWMMYRCGWATRPGQERVLAIELTRSGFEWALARACLSHYDPARFADHAAWSRRLAASPVRVQWDPERSLRLRPLPYRSLQVGLSGEAVDRYVDEWIVSITDVTPSAYRIRELLRTGDEPAAAASLPTELPYPLPAEVGAVIDASPA